MSGIENDVLFQKPKILDIGETFSVIIKFNELINAIKYLAKKDERILNKKMVFVVEEISGKKFNKKIEHTYSDYLLWNDNKIFLLPKLD